MRTGAAAGVLILLGLLLIWAGFSGRTGVVLGALLCPAQLEVADATGALPAAATAGGS